MNSITQNLEPKPSIQPRKVVIGGSLIYLILVCGLTCQAQAQTAPRIAIWDTAPGSGADRFALDKPYLEQAAGWMKAGGCEVTWLSSGELADPARLSADRYDGVVFFDAAVPTPAIEPLKDFANSGGVLINLGAGTPFFIRVQPTGKNGRWNYDPPSPRFAWQDYKLTGLVGLKYNYNAAMNNIAQLHEPTELFKRYVPPAKGFQLLLDHYWFPTVEGGEVYPLVRSRRIDGLDLQPQLYIARKGTARAILAAGKSKTITGNDDPKVWPWGKETVVAIAQIARDLHRGQLKLDPAWAIKIPDQPYGSIKPLQIRAVGRDTNPEGVKAVRRWGRFDGSGFDLKEMAGAGELPRELAGGASVTLSLPSLAAGPCYVRVRGAYATSDAALKISVGEQVLWHESFVHHTDKGAQNFFEYGAVPIEFQRVAFIPPSITGQTLVLANPGTKPLYFDAVQIESRPATGRSFAIGLGAGGSETGGGKFGPNPLSSELTRTWSNNRFSSRTQYIGAPEDPNRWKAIDQCIGFASKVTDKPELIFEGTPKWAAYSADALKEAAPRAHVARMDVAKYREIFEHIVSTWGNRIAVYELWNEINTRQFWRGTMEEYIEFCKLGIPIIRRGAPQAKIQTAGLAGTTWTSVDPWIIALRDAGVLDQIDQFPMHCYSRAGAWDSRFGLCEGHLLNVGFEKPVYANEQGFNRKEIGGEDNQAVLMNRAMARILAERCNLVSVFCSRAQDDHGVFAADGTPLPAYEPIKDYFALTRRDGRRVDLNVTGPKGSGVAGVYCVAAQHDDGTVTLVVNPCDGPFVENLAKVPGAVSSGGPDELFMQSHGHGWNPFFGKAAVGKGAAALSVAAGKQYMGFYKVKKIDPVKNPSFTFTVPKVDGKCALLLKWGAEKTRQDKTVATFTEPGTVEVKLADVQGAVAGPTEIEFSFRVWGSASVGAIKFAKNEEPAAAAPVVAAAGEQSAVVVLRLPLKPGTRLARPQNPAVTVFTMHDGAMPWAELTVTASRRTVVRLGAN